MKKRLVICALLLAVLIAMSVWADALVKDQAFQSLAGTWQGPSKMPYRQLSVYYDLHEAVPVEAIESAAAGILTQYGDGGPVLAWGSASERPVTYARRQTGAAAYAVSRNFFLLHPFPAEAGALFTFGTVGNEAVLNRHAAWALFGSENCIGERIQIEAETYRVLAVIDGPSGSVNRAAFGTEPGIYVPIGPGQSVTFCEAVLPEPVKGSALAAFQSAMPEGTVVENTGRFRLGSLWSTFRTSLDASTQTPGFLVPAWEFAARQTEKYLLLLWAARLLEIVSLCVGAIPPGISKVKWLLNRIKWNRSRQ